MEYHLVGSGSPAGMANPSVRGSPVTLRGRLSATLPFSDVVFFQEI
jgi:hypothetical protein